MNIQVKANTISANRSGVALLVVLFIVMVITVMSLGFLARSDVELACGQNFAIRCQMDYLAESGMVHAKGLIVNPEDANQPYWTGTANQQLYGGDDYYDVDVNLITVVDPCEPNRPLVYQIVSTGYRQSGGDRIARSVLNSKLYVDDVNGVSYFKSISRN